MIMLSAVLRSVCVAAALAAAIACHDATGPGEQAVQFQVAAAKVACVGAQGPQNCLQVRELIGGDTWSAWGAFYDSIEGFSYEPGYVYQLRVVRRDVPNPPADGSSVTYRLVKILYKVASPS